MQIIAMISMLLDHTAIVLWPDNIWMRIIGRLAFPIYGYFLILGYQRTRNLKRYMWRLLLIAGISQVFYVAVFKNGEWNVVFTFLAVMVVFKVLEHLNVRYAWLIVLISAVLLELMPFEYGAYALFLLLIYRVKVAPLGMHLMLNMAWVIYAGWGWSIQIFSLFVTIVIFHFSTLHSWLERFQVSKALWRIFYPAHLFLIFLVYEFGI